MGDDILAGIRNAERLTRGLEGLLLIFMESGIERIPYVLYPVMECVLEDILDRLEESEKFYYERKEGGANAKSSSGSIIRDNGCLERDNKKAR